MKYVSLFSGIEAATVAWEPLGWEPMCFAEFDEFPSAVLAERYPEVPNVGDVTKMNWKKYRNKVDLVVGGSPCQSFSIAGKREGLQGESGLMFEYIRAVREIRPRWFLWENVPGALSSEDGEAFRQLLSEMDKLGYGLAWRILDAQFFGVAQRRRRLFLVGHLGAEPPAEVLFEPESMRGVYPSSREKREALAAAARRGASSAGFKFNQGAGAGNIGFEEEQSPTCTADWHNPGVLAFAQNTRDEVRIQGDGTISGALSARPDMKQTTYVCETANTNSTAVAVDPVISMADLNANTAIGYDMVGTLKVGGDAPSVCL
jgi:DNA (cytosine-5)-methyltransferase 1|nr:MAG TPA: Cytosine specific methyltransferase [Caudoviricetes sp.]